MCYNVGNDAQKLYLLRSIDYNFTTLNAMELFALLLQTIIPYLSVLTALVIAAKWSATQAWRITNYLATITEAIKFQNNTLASVTENDELVEERLTRLEAQHQAMLLEMERLSITVRDTNNKIRQVEGFLLRTSDYNIRDT